MSTTTQPTSAAIILYGRSLLLDTVELALRENGSFPITRLSFSQAPLQLKNVPTGTIIYDQNHADPTAVFHLLSTYPGWQFIGLTAASEEVLIINSEKKNFRFPTNLSSIIQQ